MRATITGAGGFVGTHVGRALTGAGVATAGIGRSGRAEHWGGDWMSADLLDGVDVLGSSKPDVVIHCAAIPHIAVCEADPARAHRVNGELAGELALWCRRAGVRLVHVSTEQVFDGSRAWWCERDEACPIHEYGRSKLAGERAVLAAFSGAAGACVVRLSLVYGASGSGDRSASEQIVRAVARGERPRLFRDEIRTPIAATCVGRVLAALASEDRLPPIVHVGGPDRMSRAEFGSRVFEAFGLGGGYDEVDQPADRPADLSLDTSLLRGLVEAPPVGVSAGLRALA